MFFFAGSLVGSLEGGGTIAGCYANGGEVSSLFSVGGLVGFVNNSAGVYNCSSSVNVVGISSVGGFVGVLPNGTISKSYSTGSVSGDHHGGNHHAIGGLIGANRGEISMCYSTGSTSGTSSIGGLVGFNRGKISNCYSSGSVEGVNNTGGLVGYNSGGTITDSFWDVETSSKVTSAGGVGKTTAEMKQKATFTDLDFIEIWGIAENQTYPFLRRHPAGDLNQDGRVDLLDLAIFAAHWLD